MSKKKAHTKIWSIVIIGIFLLAGITAGIIGYKKAHNVTAMPALSEETARLVDFAVWYPSAPWSNPAPTSMTTIYGDLSGESISADVTSSTASLNHFEDSHALEKRGYIPDIALLADGPGSSSWGYIQKTGQQARIIIVSFKTTPTDSAPNQPLTFSCPCKIHVSVFVSKPFGIY